MGFRGSLISLRRLLLGAALVFFGLFLASSTTAQADDLGLTKAVGDLVTTATDVPAVLDPTTTATAVLRPPVEKAVAVAKPVDTVKAVVQPVEKVVQAPLEAVDPALSQPVKDVVRTTTSTVTRAATAVTTTTSAVSRSVEPLVSAVDEVTEPAVAVVETILAVPASPSLPDPPKVVEAGQDVAPSGAVPAIGPSVDAVASLLDRARTQRALRAERALTPTLADRPSIVSPQLASGIVMASAESTLARVTATRSPGDQPVAPGPEHRPQPALPAGGAASGSGAHGSFAPTGSDVATTPAALTLPATSSAAMRSIPRQPRPGPASDPGSRPD